MDLTLHLYNTQNTKPSALENAQIFLTQSGHRVAGSQSIVSCNSKAKTLKLARSVLET